MMNDAVRFLRKPLRNRTCMYCGDELGAAGTSEHVIARRFVPKGTLANCPNVIGSACAKCNGRKGELEDDLSAITMSLPVPGRSTEFALEAARKAAGSISRETQKTVAKSGVEQSFTGNPLPGLKFSFSTSGPPQMDEGRVFELARLQTCGFFYALTYNRDQHRGGFWPGGFFPVMVATRQDWGNSVQRWFMELVLAWAPRVVAVTAMGNFRIAIRRNPDAILWSWALEWNESVRIIGFFGDESKATQLGGEIPRIPMNELGRLPGGGVLRMRTEVPLEQGEDRMFDAESE